MRARWLVFVALSACGHPGTPEPSQTVPTASRTADTTATATAPRARRRVIPPEAFLASYLGWFGNVHAVDVPTLAGRGLFDQWTDYLGALGLPDRRVDVPRASETNPLRLAAVGRLGEALCVRAAEHDLHRAAPLEQRQVFAFDAVPTPNLDQFTTGFDVLHRTFLSYPASLAPAGRLARFYALFQKVEAEHEGARAPLTPSEAAWVAVCTALVQHPEAELY